ncbi:11406_t:CDS:2 [Acaulospora colombiana]|uniref:11406_t:CDS:1 n=1 Tax=Acaulospora colombiana TaxID=27376 RepID=A0ACA9MQE7_9GLOM|nr:11406_t:CDS:2 [Acaulospora colombiana]
MYSLAQRANALLAFSTTVIFGLLGAVAFVTLFIPSSPTAKIDIKELQVWIYDYAQSHAHSQSEFAFVDLKVDAVANFWIKFFQDLTSLFNWNTKQLFVSVVAEYETETHSLNQVVLWDTIIQSKEDAHIKADMHNEYNFVDITTSFGLIEVETRNKVSMSEVIKAVLLQQFLQTLLGLLVLIAEEEDILPDDRVEMFHIGQMLKTCATRLYVWQPIEPYQDVIIEATYWYIIPILKFVLAIGYLETIALSKNFQILMTPLRFLLANHPFFTVWDRILGTYMAVSQKSREIKKDRTTTINRLSLKANAGDDYDTQAIKKAETINSEVSTPGRYNLRSRKNIA